MTTWTATCATCRDRFTRPTMQAAGDALWSHHRLAHILGVTTTTVVQLDGVTWQELFLDAVRAIPVGTEFTTADLHGRIPDPPHSNHWGSAQGVASHLGLIRPLYAQRSTLETTKGSRLLRWVRVDATKEAAA